MPELVAVRAGKPRFVETSLFIARIEIAQILSDGPREAKAHLDEVLARFPSSPAATYLAGTYHTAVGDHAEALRFYDRRSASTPTTIRHCVAGSSASATSGAPTRRSTR